jgi:hypothetical protein
VSERINMKFGKSAEEAETEPSRGSGGSEYMKYLKDGDNEFRVLDEPEQWVYYWEHYNPEGFSFPCTNDQDTCPGCTSDSEKMAKVSRRVAFNAYDGQYTNVWKVPKTVADKLKNRFARLGTITDRTYIVTRLKTGSGATARYDFDMEGKSPEPLDEAIWKEFWRDPEELLANAFQEAWGSVDQPQAQERKAPEGGSELSLKERLAAERAKQEAEAKAEPEKVVSEAELRQMSGPTLVELCEKEGYGTPPQSLISSDEIVDWMLTQ